MFISVQTPGVNSVVFREQPGWIVRHNRLFDISPDQALTAVVIGGNISIWALCFTEDLLQAENEGKGLILDVGWYPEADPNGCYKLKVIHFDAQDRENPEGYDWENPAFSFKTRSLAELLTTIQQFMEATL
jgi:hypothetical protein